MTQPQTDTPTSSVTCPLGQWTVTRSPARLSWKSRLLVFLKGRVHVEVMQRSAIIDGVVVNETNVRLRG